MNREEAGWSNPKVLLVLAVIFVCGTAFGSAMTHMFLHTRPAHTAATVTHDPSQQLDAAREVGLTRLKVELGLTTDQERVVTKVLDDYAKYYQNIEDERDDVAEHGKQRILDVLNPEQQKKFSGMFGGAAQ